MPDTLRSKRLIEDARGRVVKPLDPVAMHLLRRHRLVPAPLLRAIAEAADRNWTRWGYTILLVDIAGLLMCWGGMMLYMLYISSSGGRLDRVTLAIALLQLVFISGGFYLPWLASKKRRIPRMRLAMLKHGRCPHCGYDLHGLPTDTSDQATVCPECGCAWRLSVAEVLEFDGRASQVAEQLGRGKQVILAVLVLLTLGLVLFSFVAVRRTRTPVVRLSTPPPATQPR